MREGLAALSWPEDRLGEAIEALGRAAGLAPRSRTIEVPAPPPRLDERPLSRWLETTAAWLDLEAEPVSVPYVEIGSFLRGAGPALVAFEEGGRRRWIALLSGGARRMRVIDPARMPRELDVEPLSRSLRAPLEQRVRPSVERLVARVSRSRRERTREALLRELLADARVGGCWLLRSPPGAPLGRLARLAGLPRFAAWTVVAHVVEYVLILFSWWAAAKGALQGRFDTGWLAAWLLLLVSVVPVRLLGAWAQSRLSIGAGALLKTRLLAGALRLEPNAIRHQGAGQLLGRVIESSAVETLALTGGLGAAVALVEAFLCLVVLAHGAGGGLHVVLYAAVVALTIILGWRELRLRRDWTAVRLAMTHDLVERMVGHRTRVAQEPRARWHEGEDQSLERYLETSRRLDRTGTLLSLVPRAWLLLGIGALVPQLVAGSPATVPLAVALGAVLLGLRALSSLSNGAAQVAGAAIGWEEARPLVRAAAENVQAAPAPTATATSEASTAGRAGALLVHAEDVRFRYRERGEPVLRGCSIRMWSGDRVLLEGPSGGGKSTLAGLLTGLRVPESGLLLLGGLDRHTLGAEGWRRRVVAAPQFHENHVFSATFAFNLLMGRAWPPADKDLEEAEAICRELDLGPLLDRMPAGLQQIVGETGWQLSHGEMSRLYIARALLQNADLVVLDESFAALDPETLQRALRCVLSRAKTLLVVAHP